MSGDAILLAESIGKQFGDYRVLTGAYLHARRGTITGLFGRNGCGKTTLLEISTGLCTADFGSVRYDGETLLEPRLYRLARRGLFYWPAEGSLLSPAATVDDHLRGAGWQCGSHNYEEVIEQLELGPLLKMRSGALSGGERQRCHLALVLLRSPQCLVADEPFRELSPLDGERLLRCLRRLANDGAAVLITGHEQGTMLDAVDEVLWLSDGTTRCLGAPAEAAADIDFRRRYLGT